MPLCSQCLPWLLHGLRAVLFDPDPEQVEIDPKGGASITKYSDSRHVDDIRDASRTCEICARIWQQGRFKFTRNSHATLGSRYYSDSEIYQRLFSASDQGNATIELHDYQSRIAIRRGPENLSSIARPRQPNDGAEQVETFIGSTVENNPPDVSRRYEDKYTAEYLESFHRLLPSFLGALHKDGETERKLHSLRVCLPAVSIAITLNLHERPPPLENPEIYTQYQLAFAQPGTESRVLVYKEDTSIPHSQELDFQQNSKDDFLNSARLKMLQASIADCNRVHGIDCRGLCTIRDSTFIPSRLLDLRHATGTIKLVQSSELSKPEDFKYATLSHSWGRGTANKTTPANLASHLKRISVADLNRTNQEAITLCRALGINFLWIDSLCIIQDMPNDEDFIVEANRMHLVYSHSYLNLASILSRSGDDGLLRAARPALASGLCLNLPNSKQASCPPVKPLECVFESPLLKRGWVYQELVLAPRVVFFTDSQMFLRCRQALCYELGPAPLATGESPSERITPFKPVKENDFTSAQNIDALWYRVVREYAPTTVTIDRDRYVALAGIVALCRQAYANLGVDTAFTAGWWTHMLPAALLWKGDEPQAGPEFVDTEIPSWSWLSQRQEIKVQRMEEKTCVITARLTKTDCSPQFVELPFGPYEGATITVQGPVFLLALRPRRSTDQKEDTVQDFASLLRQRNRDTVIRASEETRPVVFSDYFHDAYEFAVTFNRMPQGGCGGWFKCVLIAKQGGRLVAGKGKGKKSVEQGWSGMVVEEVAEAEKDERYGKVKAEEKDGLKNERKRYKHCGLLTMAIRNGVVSQQQSLEDDSDGGGSVADLLSFFRGTENLAEESITLV